MARIDEQKMIAEFVGNRINEDTFYDIATPNGKGYGEYSDCDEYIVYHVDYYEEDALIDQFKITPSLAEKWDYSGVDFRVYLYLRDQTLVGGCIFKYKDTSCSCHYRPTGYQLTPTQQEIRVAQRIFRHILMTERE